MILNDFKRCDITHLQNIYAQVEQKFCIEAILTTIEAIRNKSHHARDHEQCLWENLKEICDARARLSQEEEMLSELIEQFCTLGVEEQDKLERQGEQTVKSYNNLFDHISVRQRVPLIGDTLYNVYNQETGTVLTDDMIDRLGTDLSNHYIECATGQQQFDS